MKKCPRCQKMLKEHSKVCPNCGYVIGGGKYLKKSSNSFAKSMLIIGAIVVPVLLCIIIFSAINSGVFNNTASNSPNTQLIVPENWVINSSDLCYEDQEFYVDSQLLLTTDANTDYDVVKKLVKTEDGIVIGYIPFSGDYHIDFPNGKSREELNRIIETWEKESNVESVSLHYAYRTTPYSVNYQNDPWDSSLFNKVKWSESAPDGNNWWAEAICLPSVWKLDIWGDVSPVKVGVIDTIFAEMHKDLEDVIVKTWQNNVDPNIQTVDSPDHGTHVSGLIAAEIGNEVGIAGVASCASPKLYCFSMFGNVEETYITTEMHFKYAIALMLEEGVKAINISMGNSDECVFAAQRGNIFAQNDIKKFDDTMSSFLKKAISAGYDFLLIKAAGNTSGYGFIECSITETTPYGYEVVDYGTEGSISQECSTNYDWFAGITDSSVRDRIIVVGAAQQLAPYSTNYTSTYFSNCDCDVYAPGEKILSLTYSNSDVCFKRGTSQAAPIVTGIAALAWSVDPNLTAVQVKEIIEKSVPNIADQSADRVPIVNAAVAVYFTRQWGSSEGERDKQSVLMGTIYEMVAEEGEETSVAVPDVKVTLYSHDNEVSKTIPASEGEFAEYIPSGKYSISFEADGYISQTISLELLPQKAEYLSVRLTPENQIPVFFNDLPETFTSITSSIRTNWTFSIKPDGSFISTVKIPDWGDNTPDYPLGTSKITEIHGQFTNFEKASEYSYKMIAAQVENIGPFGKTYISDDVRYIVTDTAYIETGDAYNLYLPGTPYSELPQGLIDSVNNNGRHSMDEITPNTFILYHAIPGSMGYDAVYIGNRNSSPEISDQPETPMSNQLDMASTFGFTKSWDIHERSGADHYVTSLAFRNDGTFSCCAGWYQSELFAAITGTYELDGDTLLLHYKFNDKPTNVEYQVDWENQLFRQLSEENLLIPHQIGSEYPFEESAEYSAEDRANHVRLYIQRGGQPLGD